MLLARAGTSACLLALLATLVLASPSSADDIVDIDSTLIDAGLPDAFVDVLESDEGPRVTVDYDVSGTADEAAYESQARRAAELVWTGLELRVQAVDVQPSYGVAWLGGDLPAAVSFTRRDLQAAFGPRPAALDEETDAYGDGAASGSTTDVYLGGIGSAFVAGLVLLVFAGLVLAVVLLARRVPRAATPSWGGPPWPAPGWGTAPVQAAPPPSSFEPADPWRSPPA